MAESFSSALRLGGLDDYLSPAQECVLPLVRPAGKNETAELTGASSASAQPPRASARARSQRKHGGTTKSGTSAEVPPPRDGGTPKLATPTDSAESLGTAAVAAKGGSPTAASSNGNVSLVGKISLSDCLSCTGCLTSAEGILLEQQSATEFLSLMSHKRHHAAHTTRQEGELGVAQDMKGPKVVAVSLSSQCIAAVSLHFNCPPAVAAGRLSYLFRLLGVDFVYSMTAAEALALLESQKEFSGRLHQHQKCIYELDKDACHPPAADCIYAAAGTAASRVLECLLPSSGPLPLVTSYCPGSVLHAEKSLEAPLLSFLSRVRSSQQIQGLLCKSAVRGAVEAVSFLLALKAHAWPGNATATRVGSQKCHQSACRSAPKQETGTSWALLRLLLAHSPYGCYGEDLVIDKQLGGDGDRGSDVCGVSPDHSSSAGVSQSEVPVGNRSTTAFKANARTEVLSPEVPVEMEESRCITSGLLPEEVLHVCVMPCFDKKLEAVRPGFKHPGHQRNHDVCSLFASSLAFGIPRRPWAEVDIVLATSEVPALLQAVNRGFNSLPCAPLDCLVPGTALWLVAHSLRRAAAAQRNTAAGAAGPHQPNEVHAEALLNGEGASVILSAHAAEKAAAEAEEAAKALPALAHGRVNGSSNCKDGTADIARPTAILAGSGGFLEFLFQQAARGFWGREVVLESSHFDKGPNEELQSLAILPQQNTIAAGRPLTKVTTTASRFRRRGLCSNQTPGLLKGAFAYGLRNIQNVAQQLRHLLPSGSQQAQLPGRGSNGNDNSCGWFDSQSILIKEVGSSIPHIVEVGACPGGCLNGGGQKIKSDQEKPRDHAGSVFEANSTSAMHFQDARSPDSPAVDREPKIIGKNREPLTSMTRLLHTNFPLVPPQANPLVLPAYMFLFGCCYGEEEGPTAAFALAELEFMLRQKEAAQVLQCLDSDDGSAILPARFWLAPRVTSALRTEFSATKTEGKSGTAISISDLKW